MPIGYESAKSYTVSKLTGLTRELCSRVRAAGNQSLLQTRRHLSLLELKSKQC